jgi:hypothetical protein
VNNVFIYSIPPDPYRPGFEIPVLEALGSLLHERSAGDLYWEELDDSSRDLIASEFAEFVLDRAFGQPTRLSETYQDFRGHPLQ